MLCSLLAAGAIAFTASGNTTGDDGITVRPRPKERIWQVSHEPDKPITWVWPSDSTSATLTITSYCARTSSSTYVYHRPAGDETGTFELPSGTGERMYDLTMEFFAGEKKLNLETLTARVVILPETFDLLVKGSPAWNAAKDRFPRPAVFDLSWSEPAATSAVFSVEADGSVTEIPLDKDSGFLPLDMKNRLGAYFGPFTVSLSYDGAEDAALSVGLLRTRQGSVISVR